MKKWYMNLPFRNKIAMLCMVVSILPVMLLGTFSYQKLQSLLKQREREVLTESLNQAVGTLDYRMSSYLNAINFIIWDKDLKQALSRDYDNNYDMYLAYRDIIDPLFITVRNLHTEINDITIYTNNPINPHGRFLRPITDVEQTNWYGQVVDAKAATFVLSESKESIQLIWRQYDAYNKYINLIALSIDYDSTFSSLSNLFEDDFGIMILSENGHPVYIHEELSSSYLPAPSEEYIPHFTKYTDDYVIEKKQLKSYSFTAYLYRPVKTIVNAAGQITITVILIVMGCILFVLWASSYFSRVIVRPLEKLSNNMSAIEGGGGLEVTVNHQSTDEVGLLITKFGAMVNRLRYLIDEVYKSKIKQQEYEMKALQAQICPHFFYNSLSLINSKAIMADQEEISLMARHLSSFYRTTLNNGNNVISVKDEITNVSSYITIQSLMHSHSFDVEYDLDEDIYSYTMLNLLLQPLVENAIGHGIDHRTKEGRGHLKITGREVNNVLIFTVNDNGCGIPQHIIDSILTSDSKGYGIKNVHHRIQLYYGKNYGLSYESILEKGTCVTLTLPVSKP